MEQASTRDMLQGLAEQPIGSPDLQAEADRLAHTQMKPSAELKETAKRAAKIWLSQGKKPPRPRATCNAPEVQQTDIEDAVEAAGGKRGASGIEARQRTDPEEGLDPKGESPTAKSGDAQ